MDAFSVQFTGERKPYPFSEFSASGSMLAQGLNLASQWMNEQNDGQKAIAQLTKYDENLGALAALACLNAAMINLTKGKREAAHLVDVGSAILRARIYGRRVPDELYPALTEALSFFQEAMNLEVYSPDHLWLRAADSFYSMFISNNGVAEAKKVVDFCAKLYATANASTQSDYDAIYTSAIVNLSTVMSEAIASI
jgi:hypothetical protein